MPRLYRVFDPLENKESWHKTLRLANDKVNEQEPIFRPQMVVEQREGANSLDAIIECANKGFHAATFLHRTWRGTKRGGLKETTPGCDVPEPEQVEKPLPSTAPRAGSPEAQQAAAAFFGSLGKKP
jgi:hypothetical protein